MPAGKEEAAQTIDQEHENGEKSELGKDYAGAFPASGHAVLINGYAATSAPPRRLKWGACAATSAKNAPGSSGASRISESRPMRTATRLPSTGPRELSPTKVMAAYGMAHRVSPARTRKASGAVTYSCGSAISNRTSTTEPPIPP